MSKTISKVVEVNPLNFIKQIEGSELGNKLTSIKKESSSNTYSFTFSEDVDSDLENLLDVYLASHDPSVEWPEQLRAYDLRIGRVVQEELNGAPFNVVDFKRHLKPRVALNKTVQMNVDNIVDLSELKLYYRLNPKIPFNREKTTFVSYLKDLREFDKKSASKPSNIAKLFLSSLVILIFGVFSVIFFGEAFSQIMKVFQNTSLLTDNNYLLTLR